MAKTISLALCRVKKWTFPGGYSPYETRGDCVWDSEAARNAIEFFPHLSRHLKPAKWVGKPFELEVWQQKIVGSIFGWKCPDGTRRYRLLV